MVGIEPCMFLTRYKRAIFLSASLKVWENLMKYCLWDLLAVKLAGDSKCYNFQFHYSDKKRVLTTPAKKEEACKWKTKRNCIVREVSG